MQKRFRAWDGQQYWYSDDNFFFLNEYKIEDLRSAPFDVNALEQFIGKKDSKGVMIYVNDILQDQRKIYQVIWSDAECGFRKVPYNMPFPETKIDEAFMEVVGTIHSIKK